MDRVAVAARRHRLVLAVAAAFVASTFLVPTLAPVAVSDDFVYARSVGTLVEEGELRILPAAATAVAQVLWGGLFAAVFGWSFGVLRVSTVVLWLLGGLAVYGLCRQARAGTAVSALGAALYWFNPLGYVLAFTFMTDAPFTSMAAVAAYLYARDRTVAGSVVAALAFLVRQHGVLVPVAVACWLVASRRLRPDRDGAVLLAQVTAVPVLTVVAYYAAVRAGVLDQASNAGDFASAALDAGLRGTFGLVRSLAFVDLVWLGAFAFPVAVAASPALPRLVRSVPRAGWLVVAACAVVMAAGFVALPTRDRGFPYVPQFVDRAGLGPSGDLRGGRLPLVSTTVTAAVGWVVAAAALVLVVLLVRHLRRTRGVDADADGDGRRVAALAGWMVAWLAVGALVTSFQIDDAAVSYDRYLLPALPFAVVVVVWAARDARLPAAPAWVAAGALAAFAVAGTHDHLAYQSATWEMGRRAVASGVAHDDLDAGAAWDGYHLFDGFDPAARDPEVLAGLSAPLLLSEHDVIAWWVGFYNLEMTGRYVVSAEPLVGFEVVDRLEYSSWLQDDPTAVYLLRSPG